MVDERFIICHLIDYLENQQHFTFIAREVPFSSFKRRADIVAVDSYKESSFGFEIKSDKDSLQRLEGQLFDYRCTFNYVYVVTTEKFLEKVKKIGRWFGIMVIGDSGTIIEIRKPRFRKLNNINKNQKIRRIVNNKEYIDWLSSRYEPLYTLFKKERSMNMTTEKDIEILKLRNDCISIG